MARQESEVFEGLPHRKIAEIAGSYGFAAACERWHWASSGTISDAIIYGRGQMRREAGLPPMRPPGRKTTPEQETAIMAAAVAKGSIIGVGQRFGYTEDFVRSLFFERGLDYPRKTDGDRGRSVQAHHEAKRLAKGFPPITADSLRQDIAEGRRLPQMVVKYGLSLAAMRKRARGLGVQFAPERLDHAAALKAYEAGESVKVIAEQNGKSMDHVRRVLDELGAFKPHRVAPPPPPKAKRRRPVTLAHVRADIAEGLTVKEIADRRKVSVATIYSRLAVIGLKPNRKSRPNRRMPPRHELIARRTAGERIRDIAASCGVSHAAICNELMKIRRASS